MAVKPYGDLTQECTETLKALENGKTTLSRIPPDQLQLLWDHYFREGLIQISAASREPIFRAEVNRRSGEAYECRTRVIAWIGVGLSTAAILVDIALNLLLHKS